MSGYIPPYTISNKMFELVSEISEKVGRITSHKELESKPHLRRNNRIRSINSSLKIEANSLSLSDVRDVINGHLVLGDQKEIQEVKNAYVAYEKIPEIDPTSISDLKRIHGILTYRTARESGVFRKGDEGVLSGSECIFVAPPPHMVNELMRDLMQWVKENEGVIHPLILSAIFHYEFVFIHPFKDGNGRTARLWQNVILLNWEPLFEYVPIESEIKKYQEEYYKVIQKCNTKGDSTEFIEFMLKMIDEVLDGIIIGVNKQINHISTYVRKILEVMEPGVNYTTSELMKLLNLKSRISFRENYLIPAIENGFVKMTLPNTPTSKNQAYYKD